MITRPPSTPRVTIISLYYNRPNSVSESIKSLLEQTYKDVRIIALDDGSTDETLSVMRQLQAPNLEIRTHPNKGFTPSIKELMDGINTEFVAVHGSGDISHPERLQKQVEALDKDPKAVMCVTANATVDPVTSNSIGVRNFHSDILNKSDLMQTTPFTHGTVMYRLDAYRKAGGYEASIKWCSDWDLWLRMLDFGHAVYIRDIMYSRFAQEDGASFHPKKSLEQIKCKRLVLKMSGISADQREHILNTLRTDGLDAAVTSERAVIGRDLARRYIKLALMGRVAEAKELEHLCRVEHIKMPLAYQALKPVSILASKSGVSSQRMISYARSFIRK